MFCSASSGPPAAICRQVEACDVDLLVPLGRQGSTAFATDQLEGAWLCRIAAQQARPFEVRKVRVHRRGRRKPDLLPDLAHGRRIAVPVDVLDEKVPDLLLTGGEHLAPPRSFDGDERVFALQSRDSSGRRQRANNKKPPRGTAPQCAGEDLNLHGRNGH